MTTQNVTVVVLEPLDIQVPSATTLSAAHFELLGQIAGSQYYSPLSSMEVCETLKYSLVERRDCQVPTARLYPRFNIDLTRQRALWWRCRVLPRQNLNLEPDSLHPEYGMAQLRSTVQKKPKLLDLMMEAGGWIRFSLCDLPISGKYLFRPESFPASTCLCAYASAKLYF